MIAIEIVSRGNTAEEIDRKVTPIWRKAPPRFGWFTPRRAA